MSTESNKAIVQRFYEAFNGRKLPMLDEIVTPDFIDHNPGPGQPTGREGLKAALAGLQAAFPDMQIHIDGLLAEGDQVALRLTARGTNTGSLLGMPPSGRKVTFNAIEYYRLAAGRIVECWHVEDWLGVMQQLGALPEPEQRGL